MEKTKMFTLMLITALLFSTVSFMPTVLAADNSEKVLSLLSDVFSIDLSQYNVTLRVTEPQDGQSFVSYTLESDVCSLSAGSLFIGDSFKYCNLHINKGSPTYTQEPSTDIIEQSKTILQRYRTFVTQNGDSDSYLSQMEDLLNQVTESTATSITEDNMCLNITCYTARVSETPLQTVRWFYVENGIETIKKAVTLEYTDGVLTSLRDTWNLYSVGSSDSISQEAAEAIAYEAAQNYDIEFFAKDGSVYTERADVSDVTTKTTVSLQQRSNDSDALFPYWAVQFWFNGSLHGSQVRGIEVCVWGDTAMVESCNTIVVLGGEDPSQSETSGGTVAGNDMFPLGMVAIVSAVGLVIALATVGIAVKRKHSKQ
jgi:hypothetical protein